MEAISGGGSQRWPRDRYGDDLHRARSQKLISQAAWRAVEVFFVLAATGGAQTVWIDAPADGSHHAIICAPDSSQSTRRDWNRRAGEVYRLQTPRHCDCRRKIKVDQIKPHVARSQGLNKM